VPFFVVDTVFCGAIEESRNTRVTNKHRKWNVSTLPYTVLWFHTMLSHLVFD